MMAMTTSNSIKVKAKRLSDPSVLCETFIGKLNYGGTPAPARYS